MLERLFDLEGHGTSVRTEVLAGLTTFLTMAYAAIKLLSGRARECPVAAAVIAVLFAAKFAFL